MYPKTGYLCLTVAQLTNLVVLLKSRRISMVDARVYLGGIELAERREIARRVRGLVGDRAERLPRYTLRELAVLTRETRLGSLRGALRTLEAQGVLRFDPSLIVVPRCGLFPEAPLCLEMKKRGSLSRLVPIPRRLFAELCREQRRSVFLAKVAYIIRGLNLDRASGELRSRGCIKASWIAEHFGLSMRSVRLARSGLILSGFIGRDRSSFQRKLNRDGSYFEINLARYAGTAECAGTPAGNESSDLRALATVPAHSASEPAGTLTVAEASPRNGCAGMTPGLPPTEDRFAPLGAETTRRFAPPKFRFRRF